MRIAIDAHAIGRRLTGNEVHVRSLLNAFAAQAEDGEIPAHVSEAGAAASVSPRIRVRRVASNPFVRLGFTLASRVRRDCRTCSTCSTPRSGILLSRKTTQVRHGSS
jgi:hypothetical protein